MVAGTSTSPRFFLGGKRKPAQDRYFKEALVRVGWKEATTRRWDTCWFTGMPDPAFFDCLKPGMSINHIPGNNQLTIKSNLAVTLAEAHERLLEQGDPESAEQLNILPATFSMPEDYDALQDIAAAHPERKWILKPKNASKGKGIALISDPAQVPKESKWLVQEYVRRPHLYQGYKYVLRLYVLITSIDPLRLYLFHEGSVKLTSEPYDPDNFDNVYSHLTNPDINTTNPDAEHPVTFLSFAEYRAWLRDQGIDDEKLFKRIKDGITLTVIAAREKMRSRLAGIKGDPACCYELLGIDCLVDEELKPWIIECNLSPSLDICAGKGCGREVEIITKRALVEDTVQMLDIPNRPMRSPEEGEDPFSALLQAALDEWERRGGYERLFPSHDATDYLRFFPFPRFSDILLAETLSGQTFTPFRLEPHHVREKVGDEQLTLVDKRDDKPYALNPTASLIWLQATEGYGPDEISDALLAQLQQAGQQDDPRSIRQQVWNLIADWVAYGFLRQSGEPCRGST